MKPALGSPPRVRGKPRESLRDIEKLRITPARAGKTRSAGMVSVAQTDHPRACGENWVFSVSEKTVRGSPPRVRGKPMLTAIPSPPHRITPARAGKTNRRSRRRPRRKDHPRACGENVFSLLSKRNATGSPPRVRGKRGKLLLIARVRGITPARAGKTCSETRT